MYSVHTYINTCMHKCTHICKYIYIYLNIHIYIYINICIKYEYKSVYFWAKFHFAKRLHLSTSEWLQSQYKLLYWEVLEKF